MLLKNSRTIRRIEIHGAAVQGAYQLANCAMGGFTAIYLASRGFSNAQIGLTSSLVYLFSVLFQLLLGDYSDAHPSLPIKRLITAVFVAGILCAAALHFLPLPIAAMMLVYALAQAFTSAADFLISASVMQFVNAGIPIRYGWPRSVGSVTYALLALVIGWAIEARSAAIVMPLYIALAVLAVIAVNCMPQPSRFTSVAVPARGKEKHISYREMLAGNVTLVLLIAAICVYCAGSYPSYMFMIRVIERLGGDSSSQGVTLFLQAMMELPSLCLSPWFVRRFDRRTLMMIAMGFRLFRVLGILLAPSLTWFFIVSAIGGFGNGIYMFASVEFVNSIVRDGERVRAQSLLAFSGTLGAVIGNGLGGIVIDALSLDSMLVCCAALCAVAVGLMGLCARKSRA